MASTRPSLGRLLKIHAAIAGRGYPSLGQLADLCDVHSRTVERDLVTLRKDYDAPLAYSKHWQGYYYREPFQLAELPFSDEEVTAMMLGLAMVASMPNIPFTPAIQRSLEILQSWLPASLASEWAAHGQFVSYLTKDKQPASVELSITFRELLRAVTSRHSVQLTCDVAGGDHHCLVDPYHMYRSGDEWFLYGRHHRINQAVDFSLSRIRAVQLLPETFTPPDKAYILANLGKNPAIENGQLISGN